MTEKQGPGALAINLHEGSRSEYLAQYVFTAFGTAVPVPRQEDAGIDMYCTLLEPDGQRAWSGAYYSVQVKSELEPWVINGRKAVEWFIKYPLPIFLCIVQKAEKRILVYHTTPRFSLWTMPELPERFELILGTETQAVTGQWAWIGPCTLAAPILDFTINDLDDDFRSQVKSVLKFWIDIDVENMARIKNGIQQFVVPYDYETNKAKYTAQSTQGNWRFREDTFPLAKARLIELLDLVATYYDYADDMVSAVIYAMALRHLQPAPWKPGDRHPSHLHHKLNDLFGCEPGKPGNYLYKPIDLLLQMVKDELARRQARSGRTFRLGEKVQSAKGRWLVNTIDNNPNDPDGPLGTTRGWVDRGPAP
jgi:hypothetical protein